MVPICYAICFIVAYVGPNLELIGGVQNNYWHLSAAWDLEYTKEFFVLSFFLTSKAFSLVRFFSGVTLESTFIVKIEQFNMNLDYHLQLTWPFN